MANPNQADGDKPSPYLPDLSKLNRAKRPTTINISNEINPAPQVPGQNTYPISYVPPIDPRERGIAFSSLTKPSDFSTDITKKTDQKRRFKMSDSSHTAGRTSPSSPSSSGSDLFESDKEIDFNNKPSVPGGDEDNEEDARSVISEMATDSDSAIDPDAEPSVFASDSSEELESPPPKRAKVTGGTASKGYVSL